MTRRSGGPRSPAARLGHLPPQPAEGEAALQAFVRAECRHRGLLHYHTHRSDRSEPGFPDSVIVGPGGLLFRELKSQTGRPSPDQLRWLQQLRAAGADAAIWTPDDKRTGRIHNELNRLARPLPQPTGAARAALAEQLYLLSNHDDPAAAGRWDLLLAPDERAMWTGHAETITRTIVTVLPHNAEQTGQWLRQRRMSDPSAAQLFAALIRELTSAQADP